MGHIKFEFGEKDFTIEADCSSTEAATAMVELGSRLDKKYLATVIEALGEMTK